MQEFQKILLIHLRLLVANYDVAADPSENNKSNSALARGVRFFGSGRSTSSAGTSNLA